MRVVSMGGLLLMLAVSGVPAQDTADSTGRLDSLLRAHRYELRIENGRMQGPGAEFLQQQARGTQFVLLAEPHNNRDVPAFTTAIFRMLAEQYDYNHLAIESGSAMVSPLGRTPRAGHADSVRAYVQRYPNGLQFASDQELEMIAAIGAVSKARSTRIWGVDQEFGGLHALEQLVALATTADARALAERVAARARAYDAKRYTNGNTRYISRMASPADFDSLAQAFRSTSSTEALDLITALQTSHRIYQNNIYARERMSGYESNHEREELMKARFLDFYRDAQRAGDAMPRVLLKLGHWHLVRGINWGRQYSLGDFVTNFAQANQQEALSIGMWTNNATGSYGVLKQYADYEPLARAGESADAWVLLDLRPLRPFVHAGRISLNAEQERIVFGFDLALLINNTARATHQTIGQ